MQRQAPDQLDHALLAFQGRRIAKSLHSQLRRILLARRWHMPGPDKIAGHAVQANPDDFVATAAGESDDDCLLNGDSIAIGDACVV